MTRLCGLCPSAGSLVIGSVLVLINTSCAEPPKVDAKPFDGDRAIAYLSTVCELGPRISGSEGMTRQQELLRRHFEKHGATVALQKWPGGPVTVQAASRSRAFTRAQKVSSDALWPKP